MQFQHSLICSAFKHADLEGRGFLSRHQFKVAMTVVFGFCPDRWEVKQAFGSKGNAKNLITFDKFLKLVKRKFDPNRGDQPDLEHLFASLDKKLKGYLVLEDLLTAAKDVDMRISPVILEKTFKELDSSRKGYLGMDEFVEIISNR